MIWFPAISIPYYLNMCRLVLTMRLIQVGQRGSCRGVRVGCVWGACGVRAHTPLYTHTSPYSSRANPDALFDLLRLEGMSCLPEHTSVGSSGSAAFFPRSVVPTYH